MYGASMGLAAGKHRAKKKPAATWAFVRFGCVPVSNKAEQWYLHHASTTPLRLVVPYVGNIYDCTEFLFHSSTLSFPF